VSYRTFDQPDSDDGFEDDLGSLVLWPDGRHVAANGSGRVFLWERDSGRFVEVLKSRAICRDGHVRMALDPVLGRLAEGDGLRELALWDVATWERLVVLDGHTEHVAAAAFIGAEHVVSVSGDSSIRLWDAWTGACLRTVDTMPLYALADDPAGGRLAAAGGRGHVYVLDRATLALTATFRLEQARAHHEPLSPEQRRRIGIVWDRPQATIRALAWHPDGEHLLCGSWDFVPKMIDARTGRCVRQWQGHAHWVDAVAVDAAGRRLVTGSSDHTVRVWDLESERCLAVFELSRPEIEDILIDRGEILAICGKQIVVLPLP
jgi:WD40 repeat protein